MAEKRGRPSKYTSAIADEICRRLAEGETLRAICRDEHMPCAQTVLDWATADREGFSGRYAHARDKLLDHWADEIIEIADDSASDVVETATGPKPDNAAVQRSRLMVDTRKWLLSKLRPEKYGDRLEVKGEVTTRHYVVDSKPVALPVDEWTKKHSGDIAQTKH